MKYSGYIGFVKTEETSPGVYKENRTSRRYRGDVLRNVRRFSGADKVNEDIVVSNELSIVADDYMTSNLSYMKWVTWMGSKWKIQSIDIQFPRINLTIGDIYNE